MNHKELYSELTMYPKDIKNIIMEYLKAEILEYWTDGINILDNSWIYIDCCYGNDKLFVLAKKITKYSVYYIILEYKNSVTAKKLYESNERNFDEICGIVFIDELIVVGLYNIYYVNSDRTVNYKNDQKIKIRCKQGIVVDQDNICIQKHYWPNYIAFSLKDMKLIENYHLSREILLDSVYINCNSFVISIKSNYITYYKRKTIYNANSYYLIYK